MLRIIAILLFLLLQSISADTYSDLVASNGEITHSIRDNYLAQKKSEMSKAITDSGFSIRQSTLDYIDLSPTLYEGVYGVLTDVDPWIILNIDSLLIAAENDNNGSFWDDKQDVLLAATMGRRGFGVGQVQTWEKSLSLNVEYLDSARSQGVSYPQWSMTHFIADTTAVHDRRYYVCITLKSNSRYN